MDPLFEVMKFSSPPSSPSFEFYTEPPSTGEDRLSDLPEPLLHHIFSTLPTNQVHQTCILSKKWTHFWASLPYVYFDVDDYEDEIPSDVSDLDDYEDCPRRGSWDEDLKEIRFCCSQQYVDKYMKNRSLSGSDLEGFSLRWYAWVECSPVKDWIVKAVARNVRELDIYLGVHDAMFTIPAVVFSAASSVRAIKLELRFDDGYCKKYSLHVPCLMLSAPNLRTLELIRIKLPKGGTKGELILCCPNLETLILKNCYHKHLKVLNLSLNQLKKLEIDNSGNNRRPYGEDDIQGPYDRLGDCKLELHTPNVSTFVYNGDMYKDCSLGNFVALNDVNVSLYPPFVIASPERLSDLDLFTKTKNSNSLKLLNGLNGATTLALGELEIYFEAPETLEELLTSYTNLRKLELQASLVNNSSLTWLVSFLCKCSSIETLVLHTIQRWRKKKEEPVLPLRPLNHLKYVAVRGLEGDKSELEFLRSLLKNAVNLETLVVSVDESENFEIKRGDRLKFHAELMKLSQQFPKVKLSFEFYKSYKACLAPLSFTMFRYKLLL